MWNQILQNYPLIAAVLAMIIAQVLKVPLHLITDGEFDLKRVFSTGGMPSSHSAFVVALATALGITYGFTHPYFAISVVFGAVVMYDAAGIRREAGKQATVINVLVREMRTFGRGFTGLFPGADPANRGKLKEMLGHEPIEVAGGILLGIAVALYLMRYYG